MLKYRLFEFYFSIMFKPLRKDSFQASIVELLRNHPEGMTMEEIATLFGKSIGSTSGTLYVLYKEGYLHKEGFPFRYFYKEFEYSNSSEHQDLNLLDDDSSNQFIRSVLTKIDALDKKIKNLDSQRREAVARKNELLDLLKSFKKVLQ